jgi:hypothetical protein
MDADLRLLSARPEPLDGPMPEMFTAFDEEFFVDWQVADADSAGPEKHILFR